MLAVFGDHMPLVQVARRLEVIFDGDKRLGFAIKPEHLLTLLELVGGQHVAVLRYAWFCSHRSSPSFIEQ